MVTVLMMMTLTTMTAVIGRVMTMTMNDDSCDYEDDNGDDDDYNTDCDNHNDSDVDAENSGILTECGLGISVVLVLLEGGYDAIDDVAKSLTSKIPVVLCEGTGRAADILAYAFMHMFTNHGYISVNSHLVMCSFGLTVASQSPLTCMYV